MISTTTALFIPHFSHAMTNNTNPDYFREFRIPLIDLTDPMYERIQIVRMANYVAYHSPFGIIPVDLFLIAKKEAEFLTATDPTMCFYEAMNMSHSIDH